MILALLVMTLANGKANTTNFVPLNITSDTYADEYTEYFYNNVSETEDISQFLEAYGEAAGKYGRMVSEANFTKFILDKGNFDYIVY